MSRKRRAPGSKQRGTLIIALMAGIAIVMILSTVAVQNWADVVRRDNEAEMIFRAQDLVRALKRFQADKGKLPTELKELMEPGQKGQYMLRRLWKDPLVKGGQWQLLYAAPGGGLFDPSVQPPPGQGGTQPGGTQPGGLGQAFPPSTSLSATQGDAGGFPPIGGGKEGAAGDPTGLPIAGVKSKCTEHPFRKYKEKTEYSEWVFSIFDLDQQGRNPAATGVPPSNAGGSFPPQGQNPQGQNPPGQLPPSISPPTQIPPPGQAPGDQK